MHSSDDDLVLFVLQVSDNFLFVSVCHKNVLLNVSCILNVEEIYMYEEFHSDEHLRIEH